MTARERLNFRARRTAQLEGERKDEAPARFESGEMSLADWFSPYGLIGAGMLIQKYWALP